MSTSNTISENNPLLSTLNASVSPNSKNVSTLQSFQNLDLKNLPPELDFLSDGSCSADDEGASQQVTLFRKKDSFKSKRDVQNEQRAFSSPVSFSEQDTDKNCTPDKAGSNSCLNKLFDETSHSTRKNQENSNSLLLCSSLDGSNTLNEKPQALKFPLHLLKNPTKRIKFIPSNSPNTESSQKRFILKKASKDGKTQYIFQNSDLSKKSSPIKLTIVKRSTLNDTILRKPNDDKVPNYANAVNTTQRTNISSVEADNGTQLKETHSSDCYQEPSGIERTQNSSKNYPLLRITALPDGVKLLANPKECLQATDMKQTSSLKSLTSSLNKTCKDVDYHNLDKENINSIPTSQVGNNLDTSFLKIDSCKSVDIKDFDEIDDDSSSSENIHSTDNLTKSSNVQKDTLLNQPSKDIPLEGICSSLLKLTKDLDIEILSDSKTGNNSSMDVNSVSSSNASFALLSKSSNLSGRHDTSNKSLLDMNYIKSKASYNKGEVKSEDLDQRKTEIDKFSKDLSHKGTITSDKDTIFLSENGTKYSNAYDSSELVLRSFINKSNLKNENNSNKEQSSSSEEAKKYSKSQIKTDSSLALNIASKSTETILLDETLEECCKFFQKNVPKYSENFIDTDCLDLKLLSPNSNTKLNSEFVEHQAHLNHVNKISSCEMVFKPINEEDPLYLPEEATQNSKMTADSSNIKYLPLQSNTEMKAKFDKLSMDSMSKDIQEKSSPTNKYILDQFTKLFTHSMLIVFELILKHGDYISPVDILCLSKHISRPKEIVKDWFIARRKYNKESFLCNKPLRSCDFCKKSLKPSLIKRPLEHLLSEEHIAAIVATKDSTQKNYMLKLLEHRESRKIDAPSHIRNSNQSKDEKLSQPSLVTTKTHSETDIKDTQLINSDSCQYKKKQKVFNKSSPYKSVDKTFSIGYSCPICTRIFQTEWLLVKHSITHQKFICDECGEFFSTEHNFSKHLTKHLYDSIDLPCYEMLCCPICQSLSCVCFESNLITSIPYSREYKIPQLAKRCFPFKSRPYSKMNDHLKVTIATLADKFGFKKAGCKNIPLAHANQAIPVSVKNTRSHAKSNLFNCSKCDSLFYSHDELNEHIVLHNIRTRKRPIIEETLETSHKKVAKTCQEDATYRENDTNQNLNPKKIKSAPSSHKERFSFKQKTKLSSSSNPQTFNCCYCSRRGFKNEKVLQHHMRYRCAKMPLTIKKLMKKQNLSTLKDMLLDQGINLNSGAKEDSTPNVGKEAYTSKNDGNVNNTNAERNGQSPENQATQQSEDIFFLCSYCSVPYKTKKGVCCHLLNFCGTIPSQVKRKLGDLCAYNATNEFESLGDIHFKTVKYGDLSKYVSISDKVPLKNVCRVECIFCHKVPIKKQIKSHLLNRCHKIPVSIRKKIKLAEYDLKNCFSMPHSSVRIRKLNENEDLRHCSLCSDSFDNMLQLLLHSSKHLQSTIHFKCPNCLKKFPLRVHIEHLFEHLGKTPYHCHFCSDKFSYHYSLIDHLVKDHRFFNITAESSFKWVCNEDGNDPLSVDKSPNGTLVDNDLSMDSSDVTNPALEEDYANLSEEKQDTLAKKAQDVPNNLFNLDNNIESEQSFLDTIPDKNITENILSECSLLHKDERINDADLSVEALLQEVETIPLNDVTQNISPNSTNDDHIEEISNLQPKCPDSELTDVGIVCPMEAQEDHPRCNNTEETSSQSQEIHLYDEDRMLVESDPQQVEEVFDECDNLDGIIETVELSDKCYM